ncbi:M23 family metallopeptidase [Roseburia sp. 831b]|uniref:M23 family metallopeptidase n=1 Tax=Roseburia sp. 831b TaxID=1261635 RepID=UPI000952E6FC|nr:M23 family metallopeptidase [Roseburia sp. 831b]WVK73359.1 M23 family metallopeptidase [Roseburia sp. 831b]
MKKRNVLQIGILFEMILLVIIVVVKNGIPFLHSEAVAVNGDGFIKWVDFNVSYEALERAYELDLESHDTNTPLNWIELLAYAGAKGGGEFTKDSIAAIEEVAEKIRKGESTMEELSAGMKYYPYYKEAYSAVLDGYVGTYEIEEKQKDGTVSYVEKYGLKAFSPIAKGFEYQDYDDFGVSRSYGYKREHLGHDMMGQIGTPIIAVESGVVEALGWNQYGGWRIGIRSYDTKRYYYYAHLRQNYPYVKELKEGSKVTAGDVIGYMGHTGYSTTENVNNIEITHLHFGVQLIFDESQKDGNGEIWINVYPLAQFLHQNQSEVEKVTDSKEWKRVYQMREEAKSTEHE